MSQYVSILTYSEDTFGSKCCGIFQTEKEAIDALIKVLVETYHIPFDQYREVVEENCSSELPIYKANLQTREEFINFICNSCSNISNLLSYIKELDDTYFNVTWNIQIVKFDK